MTGARAALSHAGSNHGSHIMSITSSADERRQGAQLISPCALEILKRGFSPLPLRCLDYIVDHLSRKQDLRAEH